MARSYAELGLNSESENPSTPAGETTADAERGPRGRIEQLHLEAASFIDQPDAATVHKSVRNLIDSFTLPQDIEDLFRTELRYGGGSSDDWLTHSYDDGLAQEETIGRWLKRKENQRFYARPHETEPRKRSITATMDLYAPSIIPARVIGFTSTATVDYDWVRLRAVSKLSSVDSFELAVVFLWSRRKLAMFSYCCQLEEQQWDQLDQPESVDWRTWLVTKGELVKVPTTIQSLLKDFVQHLAGSAGITIGGHGKEP